MLRAWRFRLLALLEASVLAPTSFAAEFVVVGIPFDLATSVHPAPVLIFVVGLVAGLISFPVFLAALFFVGAPVWWLAHRLGLRSGLAAVILGSAGAVAGGALLQATGLAPDWPYLVPMLAAPGAVAGWVVWSVAYDREPKPPPVRPS